MHLLKILLLGAFSFSLTACKSSVNQNVNLTVTSEAADGLDLKAVTALLKTVKTPEELEKQINSGNPRICNLDLNEDDTVDYVKVTEYQKENIKGFSLSTELAPNDVQELATIEISQGKDGQQHLQTHGNRSIYGNHHYYHHSGFGIGDYLLMSYLFRPHSLYVSSYGYNNYPRNYTRRNTVPAANYRSGVSKLDSSGINSKRAPVVKSSNASPNKSRTSSRIKAPLRNPTSSQRAFQKRNPSRTVRTGGFGSRSSKSGGSSGSIRSSSRSGSSFGGGK